MKKVLAMALAFAIMVAATASLTSVIALACDRTNLPIGVGYSVCIDDDADILDTSEIADFGARVLGTTDVTITIPILYDGFQYWNGTTYVSATAAGADYTAITSAVTGQMELVFSDPTTKQIFRKPNFIPAGGGKPARIELVAENIGLCQGEIWIEFTHADYDVNESMHYSVNGQFIDPTINKTITSLTGKNLTEVAIEFDDKAISATELTNLNASPDSELRFLLNTDFFNWDPVIQNMGANVRKSTMDNNKIDVSTRFYGGSKYIDSIDIKNVDGVAWVVVEFTEYLPYVDEKSFDFTICLTYRDKKDESTMVQVTGIIANEEMNVDGYTYANIGEGIVAVADEYNKSIELDLGNGLSVTRSLAEGKKYYGVALDEQTNADREIMEYYPSIRKVLNLTTVNMETSGNVVKINPAVADSNDRDFLPSDEELLYYIYDASGKYLGTTNDMLPFRNKYYFSTGIITMDVSIIEGLDDEDFVGLENPETGSMEIVPVIMMGLAFLSLGALTLDTKRRV